MIHLMLEIVGVWLVAILMGMPLFASMGLAAFAFVVFSGLSASIVPQKMAQSMNSFPLVAAPLFILMGNLLGAAKLTDRIVRFATSLVGALRGGYAHASILSSMIFAGMVGSAVADAAGDVGVHPVEILLVQIGEAGGVALGGLDLLAVVVLHAHSRLVYPRGRRKSHVLIPIARIARV